jgi:hypothetical protein
MLNEIYKMLFKTSFYARFLASCDWDESKALQYFGSYVKWRVNNQIDMVLDVDIQQEGSIKQFLPNGFHETDKDGRPVFYLHIGQLKLQQLTDCVLPEIIVKYFVKEMEHTWREKFDLC